MRILVVGDSYCPSSAFREAFRRLGEQHEVAFADVTDEPDWTPATPSELRLKEYMGSPPQVIAAFDGHDVLVVQGAPVSDAVLDASPALRLVCCARGGPVNVDVTAATERGIPVVTTPGKNADAVAELTVAFMVMLARRLPEVVRHVEAGGEFGHDNY
jgi:D-3-phosphoglycerate dehydrogenase / 2-oxoglutarate reductase